jgi:hypothetical protein
VNALGFNYGEISIAVPSRSRLNRSVRSGKNDCHTQMNISESDFDSAIEKSPSKLWLAPVPSTVMSWFSEIGVSDALVGFFQRHSYTSWIQIGHVSFNSVSELVHENMDPQNHAVYKSRLLIIGSGLNGDPIVVNMESGKAGYLCHDELWESEEDPEIADVYCELPHSLGEFYLKAATSEDFPVDFYQALETISKSP